LQRCGQTVNTFCISAFPVLAGQLRIIADFPNRPPVILSGLADMDEDTSASQSRSKPTRK
jgi:hypothetical protein